MSTTSTGQPSGAPAAGWYADPAGTGERWWDGARWTEHARAATTAVAPGPGPAFVSPASPASPAAFASPTTPAAFVAPATRPAYPAGAGGYGGVGPAYGGAGQPGWGTPQVGWGAQAYGPPPKNGTATAALVLSLAMIVAAIATGYVYGSLLAVVLAARGLQAASAFEKQGHPPVGRARAAWALGISILMFVGVIGLKVLEATL